MRIILILIFAISIVASNNALAAEDCILFTGPAQINTKIVVKDSVCFHFEGINQSQNLKIMTMRPAYEDHAFNIRLYDQTNTQRNTFSGSDVVNMYESNLNRTNSSLTLQINELEDYDDIKVIQLAYMNSSSGEPIIAIFFHNLNILDDEPGGPGGGVQPLMLMMSQSSSSCDGTNTPPAAPSDFNLNQNLAWASTYLKSARIMSPLGSYMLLQMLFDSGNRFDLKAHGATADFGNFFYGAALARAGFTDFEIYGGAAAQQVGEDGGTYGDMLGAFFTQKGDNQDDTPLIKKGISYADDVYENDGNKNNVKDSCSQTPNTSSPSSNGSGVGIVSNSGYGAGWSPNGSCYGFCGTVTITDL